MIRAAGYGCISVKTLLTVKIIREKIKMLSQRVLRARCERDDDDDEGEGEEEDEDKRDAKRTRSRQHHEITLLRICLLCTTNWFTVSSTYDDIKNNGRMPL